MFPLGAIFFSKQARALTSDIQRRVRLDSKVSNDHSISCTANEEDLSNAYCCQAPRGLDALEAGDDSINRPSSLSPIRTVGVPEGMPRVRLLSLCYSAGRHRFGAVTSIAERYVGETIFKPLGNPVVALRRQATPFFPIYPMLSNGLEIFVKEPQIEELSRAVFV